MNGVRWIVGNGSAVRFWDDIWLPSRTILQNVAIAEIPEELRNVSVADMSTIEGGWRFDLFSEYLPQQIVPEINACIAATFDQTVDRPIWSLTTNGIFTASSAYSMLSDHDVHGSNRLWCQVWSWNGPQRVLCLIWMALHGGLKTNELRTRCNISWDSTFPLYNSAT